MTRLAEAFLLCGFALAQPMYALLAAYPEYFAAHDVGLAELAILVGSLSGAVPLLVAGLGGLAGRYREQLHGVIVALMIAAWLVQPLADLGTSVWSAVGVCCLALALGAAGSRALLRSGRLRDGARFAAALALIFPVLFLASPNVRAFAAGEDEAAPGAPPIESETTVVLLIFDELPLSSLMGTDGQIDAERLPGFAGLARGAHWFRNATAVTDSTGFSLPAMFSGKRLDREDPAAIASGSESLFSLLANGRGVRSYEGAIRLCPSRVCGDLRPEDAVASGIAALLWDTAVLYAHRLVPAFWRAALPDVGSRWGGFAELSGGAQQSAGKVDDSSQADPLRQHDRHGPKPLAAAIRTLREGERPTLLYVHLMLPHAPWQYYPTGMRYAPVTPAIGVADGLRSVGDGAEWASVQALQRHLLQVGYADRLLGRLLDELRAAGLYDRAMVIVGSDHGHAFRPGVFTRRLSGDNLADILSVPLLIKRPGQAEDGGRVDDRDVELIDVAPTIAAELGVEIPWEMEGQPLFADSWQPRGQKRAVPTLPRGRRDPEQRFTVAMLKAQRDASVERLRRDFGAGSDGLHRIVPDNDPALRSLLGHALAEFEIERPKAVDAMEVPFAKELAAVDRRRGVVPSQVIGRMRAKPGTGARYLAIALNGRIEAVTRSYADPSGWGDGFTALLPEAALRQGENLLEILEVSRSGDGLRLIRREIER